MNQNLNYCTHAIESFNQSIKKGLLKHNMPMLDEYLGIFVDLLKKSVKFILPEGGRVLDIQGYEQKSLDMFKLPYDIVALEYFVPKINIKDAALVQVPKRIVLAVDAKVINEYLDNMYSGFPGFEPGAVLFPVLYYDNIKTWMPLYSGMYVAYDQKVIGVDSLKNHVVPEWPNDRPSTYSRSKNAFVYKPIPIGELWSSQKKSIPDEVAFNNSLFADINDEWLALLELTNILNCKNVEVQNNPPSEALNKKRIKNGNAPFFEYKTLHIKTSHTVSSGAGIIVADRNSPRVHLRRGHIRILPSGETTWVQSCVVGSSDKGFIKKDYKIS